MTNLGMQPKRLPLTLLFCIFVYNAHAEDVEIGSTYVIKSLLKETAITVLENGDVTVKELLSSPDQQWTIVQHPLNASALRFNNAVHPNNELSGYESSTERKKFPRILTVKHWPFDEGVVAYEILEDGHWCLTSHGIGERISFIECEIDDDGGHLWALNKVV